MPEPAGQAVFLSYAREDTDPVQRIAEALRAVGVEVWFDQSELRGGDAWDQQIRRQIKDCALFVPVISARTQARREGYFRREWKQAAERTRDMADGTPFLLPVVIDATPDAVALVPEEFRSVQWTRLTSDPAHAAFTVRVKSLLGHVGSATPSTSGVGTAVPSAPRPAPAIAAATEKRPLPSRRARWVPAAAMALGVGGYAAWHSSRPGMETSPGPTVAVKPGSAAPTRLAPGAPVDQNIAVAVLPFVNVGNDPANEYFSDGLTEEIMNLLMRERGLRVIGRTSSFSYKGRNVRLSEIARDLNVARIVEGSVRRAGNQVRITASLTGGADEIAEPLGSFDGELTNVFALQDKVARAVVEKLTRRAVMIAPVVLTKNPEAYDAYLRGRELQTRTLRSAKIIEMYQRAVELDPDFALAWAQMASATIIPIAGGWDVTDAAINQVRTAVSKAIALQPNLPEAILIRASMFRCVDFDFGAAKHDLERVETLQAPSAEFRIVQSSLAADVGDWSAAINYAREAVALDPQNGGHLNSCAVFLGSRGNFAEADRLLASAQKQNPSELFIVNRLALRFAWRGPRAAERLLEEAQAGARGAAVEHFRVRLAEALGDLPGALALAQASVDALRDRPGAFEYSLGDALADMARLLEGEGRNDEARRVWDEMRQSAEQKVRGGQKAPWLPLQLATAEAGLGRRKEVAALLTGIRVETERRKSALRPTQIVKVIALYGMLGMVDEAIALQQRSMDEGFQPGYLLRHRPEFKPLHSDPRFQPLMKRAEAWADAQPNPVD